MASRGLERHLYASRLYPWPDRTLRAHGNLKGPKGSTTKHVYPPPGIGTVCFGDPGVGNRLKVIVPEAG